MKLSPVSKVLEAHLNKVAHARGAESTTAIITGRNAFGPCGASYNLDRSGLEIQDVTAPSDDFMAGDEVVVNRVGNGAVMIQQMGDITKRPTQAAQWSAIDVTGRNTI